ncbi:MAG: helix-turn-helix domain-containing protein [Nostoc sp. DedQUE04]|uniref:helix-turn-helix domain-containing protein n=1 Tax=Nostoc sp. DedQUE04 TaxID=3075390 RepID=UPI002AD52626|nr:helix-turn-helix domain-containing protein [Nostoc sp. DedQUE04]MDZ8140778.1 helix-turn-helix domain-containing protein [Nostoc sp. DedQUE04]
MGFRNGKPSKQFTAIPNSLIRDHNVTDSTFRLISWVASHDENFDINFTVIEKHLGYKRDKIRNAIKNAEQNDYLVRVQENNPNNGKFDWQYYIFTSKEDTKLFRENHSSIGESSIGESSIGGSSIGWSSIGGSSTPHIEKQLEENKLEEKHIQEAPPTQNAFTTQESCVCETEQTELTEQPRQPELEEPTPQQPTSLSKNSEYEQQTDNPSRGSTIAAGSFEKSEQSNKPQLTCPYKTAQNVKELIDAWITDPTAFADDFVPLVVREKIKWNRWVLPWHSGERKLNNLYQNFNPIVVDFLAAELATKSKRSAQLEITHAIAVMNTWEKTKGGWTNLMQRYNQALQTEKQPLPQLHTATTKRPSNTTSITLEDALAQDRMRRQQEQSIRVPSNGYQQSQQMLELKAKLQAKANEPKVSSNSKPSSTTNLREVEAQLKLALRA